MQFFPNHVHDDLKPSIEFYDSDQYLGREDFSLEFWALFSALDDSFYTDSVRCTKGIARQYEAVLVETSTTETNTWNHFSLIQKDKTVESFIDGNLFVPKIVISLTKGVRFQFTKRISISFFDRTFVHFLGTILHQIVKNNAIVCWTI